MLTTIKVFFISLLGIVCLHASDLQPKDVAILYNKDSKESAELARYYQKARAIPSNNLIGISCSQAGHITREAYNTLKPKIQDELKRAERLHKIRVIVCMRDVPYGIKRDGKENNEASFDSELTLVSANAPLKSALNNHYFKKNQPLHHWLKETPPNKVFRLVTRIDGPDFKICKRIIDDSIATEESGLWGMTYLDKALKGKRYKIGDEWLDSIEQLNWAKGFPTVKNVQPQTLVKHYPMIEPAMYFGWYTTHRNGPFLHKDFRFKKGAVAVHLHSFSASNLRKNNKNWVGPLLDKGACVVLGNVYEPYLQITTYFDLFHDRLLNGYTVAEAAYMATPAISWQNVIIGDPLYRPFKHLKKGSGAVTQQDKLYRATNVIWKLDSEKAEQRIQRLQQTAALKKSGLLYEVVGLYHLKNGNQKLAFKHFETATHLYKNNSDQLRCQLHKAEIMVTLKKPAEAIKILQSATLVYKDCPHIIAARTQLLLLNPPRP